MEMSFHYFENGTTSKPEASGAPEATVDFYEEICASPSRYSHRLGSLSTGVLSRARETAFEYFQARSTNHIVFIGGATEALDLVNLSVLGKGNEAVVSSFDHNTGLESDIALSRNIIPEGLDIGTLNIAATIAVIPAFEQSISSKTRKCKEYILRLFRTLLNAVDGLYQFCLFSFISSPVLSNQNPRMYAGTYGQVLDKKYRILALAYIQYAPLRHDNIGSLPNCTVRLSSCHGTMDEDGRVLVRTLQSLDSEIQ